MYFILNILMTRDKDGLKNYVVSDKWGNSLFCGYYDDFTHDSQYLTFKIKGLRSGIVDIRDFEFIFFLTEKEYTDMIRRG